MTANTIEGRAHAGSSRGLGRAAARAPAHARVHELASAGAAPQGAHPAVPDEALRSEAESDLNAGRERRSDRSAVPWEQDARTDARAEERRLEIRGRTFLDAARSGRASGTEEPASEQTSAAPDGAVSGAARSLPGSAPSPPAAQPGGGAETDPGVGTAASGSGASARSAPAAAPPAAPIEAIPERVEWLAGGGGGSARLRLHPPELGEIDLHVRIRDRGVEVTVVTHERGAQLAIEGQRELLAQGLQARELRMDAFTVTSSPSSGSAQDGDTGAGAEGRRSGDPGAGGHSGRDAAARRPAAGETSALAAAGRAPGLRGAAPRAPGRIDLHV